MSALGGEAHPSFAIGCPLMTREKRHADSNSTFPAKNDRLPAPRLSEQPIQATEMQGVFCWDVKALSLQLGQITLQFPKLQGETGWLQTASTATL
jgi:hypothetical protein